MAIHTFHMRILTSFSVDEILLPRYMKWFTIFRRFPFCMEKVQLSLKHSNSLLSDFRQRAIPLAVCSMLLQQKFGFRRYICQKCLLIGVICIHDRFWRISSVFFLGGGSSAFFVVVVVVVVVVVFPFLVGKRKAKLNLSLAALLKDFFKRNKRQNLTKLDLNYTYIHTYIRTYKCVCVCDIKQECSERNHGEK